MLRSQLKAGQGIVARIFNRIDRERKGNLTLEDIMEGAQRDPEFQSRLRVMEPW